MKKKWQAMVGLVLSLVTIIMTAAPALAQKDKPAAMRNLRLLLSGTTF